MLISIWWIFPIAGQLAAFAAGVKQMLEDVQERLVYRTHIYIQTDIIGYKPAPGDLAYPAKLEMMEVSVYIWLIFECAKIPSYVFIIKWNLRSYLTGQQLKKKYVVYDLIVHTFTMFPLVAKKWKKSFEQLDVWTALSLGTTKSVYLQLLTCRMGL